ncbi:MAG TPA: S26 family signal peptidase, partial [Planctomycetota bacterium]|nr:S26 family signal peptidase [Planctomycetota bacterium]
MQPTLLGDPSGGDRVLVDRVTLLARRPRRYEIVAFEHPRDRERELVKRVAGLPRERIQIADGDLVVDGHKLRKSAWERRRLAVPLLRWPGPAASERLDGPADRVEWGAEGRTMFLRTRSADDATLLSLRGLAGDGFEDEAGRVHPGTLPVFDLAVRAEARLLAESGTLLAELRKEGDTFRLELARTGWRDATRIRVTRSFATPNGGESAPSLHETVLLDAPGPAWPDRFVSVAFWNFDDRVSLDLDGREVATVDYEGRHPRIDPPPGSAGWGAVRVGVRGADLEVRTIEIDRDLHYVARGSHAAREPFELGPDEYFVLGDRSADSDDSREFGAVTSDRLLGLVRAIVAPLARLRWLP